MLNIVRSNIAIPLAWLRKRRKPIILPHDTLIHILHYFSRKQLVKQLSRVNSSFFHVANRFLPNVHVIEDDNISFSPNVFSEDGTLKTELCKQDVQTFEALTLGKYQKSYTRFKSYTRYKSYTYYKSYTRFEKAMNKITKKRITAEEYLKNMPPAFIRFPKFSIGFCPDEVLLKFLRDSKQHFENCLLFFVCRRYFHSSNPDEKYLQKAEEMLSDIFPNPSEIYFSPCFASEKLFKTTGARNCDKLQIWYDNNPKCTKDTIMEWIQWKQNESGSRRHLVLIWWSLDVRTLMNRRKCWTTEMLEDLKHAFETAAKPLSYVITFAYYYNDEAENHSEFHLDNERTGERLSLFRDKRYCYRLWRRTVTSSDSTWLSALIGGEFMEKEVREAARETGFDEEFYGYYLPVVDDGLI
ncbi:hypothetical protein DdX_21245 [Ditylenchus destructor]|uniref:F-box domain-containing protein n=1 Tax=Ditylenchus destructor TaxID=166010 RepID=A0AAD4QVG0_9BILA|nr:hypothetical protein DdX_21245 [Ditylenchus destructor]